MEISTIELKGKKSLTLPYQEIQVMPIGDVQLGSQGVHIDRLKRQISWALKQGNVYFLGMGDYIDVMSPSNREAWKAVRVYDSVKEMMTRGAEGLIKDFLKIVKGTEGKWLGLLEGHHFFEFEDGTTSDMRIASQLKAPFLGTCAYVRIQFKDRQHHSLNCDIWCHHGAGNGIYPHAPLNKLYHVMNHFEADVYLIGHQTKKPAVKVPRLKLNSSGRLVVGNKVLAGTGGFTEGYTQGSKQGRIPRGGYVEKALLNPVYLGSPLIKIRPVYSNTANRLDLNVEI